MCLFRSLALAALTTISAASYATTFTLTGTGTGVNLNVTVTGTAETGNRNAFDLTSATGTFDGLNVSLYLPGTSSGQYNITTPNAAGNYFTYNNVVYTSGDIVDGFGLLFNVGSGASAGLANFFTDASLPGAPYVYLPNPDPATPEVPVSLTLTQTQSVSPTPEPSSFVLLGTGLLGALGTMRRRLGF